MKTHLMYVHLYLCTQPGYCVVYTRHIVIIVYTLLSDGKLIVYAHTDVDVHVTLVCVQLFL